MLVNRYKKFENLSSTILVISARTSMQNIYWWAVIKKIEDSSNQMNQGAQIGYFFFTTCRHVIASLIISKWTITSYPAQHSAMKRTWTLKSFHSEFEFWLTHVLAKSPGIIVVYFCVSVSSFSFSFKPSCIIIVCLKGDLVSQVPDMWATLRKLFCFFFLIHFLTYIFS